MGTPSNVDGTAAGSTTAAGGTASVVPGGEFNAGRYADDLTFIAAPRPPGSEHWQAVQDYCLSELGAAGLSVERQAYGTGVNVIAELPGSAAPDELIIIGAHYDSTTDCPGADDNASGVAGVLEAARVLATVPRRATLVFACWDEEETGHSGSQAYVESLGRRSVAAYLNFEMIGFASNDAETQSVPTGFDLLFPAQVANIAQNQNRGDFIAIVADPASAGAAAEFVTQAMALGLPVQSLLVPAELLQDAAVSDLRRSDHVSFWTAGLPGMMITDTADFRNPNYHCDGGSDSVETLDLGFAGSVVRATVATAAALAD
jgi:Zn-dependent M28 family amino/carboxypeptidase